MTDQKTEQKPADHKAIREALEAGGEFTQDQLRALLADLDAMRGALELYLAHAPEPECAIWRHVQQKARAALKGASA